MIMEAGREGETEKGTETKPCRVKKGQAIVPREKYLHDLTPCQQS